MVCCVCPVDPLCTDSTPTLGLDSLGFTDPAEVPDDGRVEDFFLWFTGSDPLLDIGADCSKDLGIRVGIEDRFLVNGNCCSAIQLGIHNTLKS